MRKFWYGACMGECVFAYDYEVQVLCKSVLKLQLVSQTIYVSTSSKRWFITACQDYTTEVYREKLFAKQIDTHRSNVENTPQHVHTPSKALSVLIDLWSRLYFFHGKKKIRPCCNYNNYCMCVNLSLYMFSVSICVHVRECIWVTVHICVWFRICMCLLHLSPQPHWKAVCLLPLLIRVAQWWD